MRTTHGGPSGPSGKKETKFDHGVFVAWDGEGLTLHRRGCPEPEGGGCGCRHEYAYLANSVGGDLVRPEGMDTREALTFLTEQAALMDPLATHVCYGLSYDANMILRDLPMPDLKRIWQGERVRVLRRFMVAYRPRKSFWVKDYSTDSSLTLWDPFGFYQSSFVKAIVDNLGPDYPDLPLIRAGKKRRSSFAASDIPFVRSYTGAELRALVALMGKLRESFISANLKLKRWDGAGAVAAALLEREGIKNHLATTPEEVQAAALFAYAGGRIETLRFGFHDGKIWHYDIRSAYPFAMVGLPSIRHGRWFRVSGMPAYPFSVVKVRWDYTRTGDRRTVYPFAFRDSGGSIYFPTHGTTWAWYPEIAAAWGIPDYRRGMELLDAWEFRPSNERERPFAWVADLYKKREAMKRTKNPAQKALKLGLNSGYGKLAQNVGGTKERPPPFHQLEYAGYITSETRARLFKVAVEADRDCITLATDGIYSTAPIADLDCSEGLGHWEAATHEAMLIAQSGVYFLRDRFDGSACPKCGGPMTAISFGCVRCAEATCAWSNLVEHYRGFDEDTLNPDRILDAWRHGQTELTAASTRFLTMGRSVVSSKAFERWRTWVEEPRMLDIHATGKRLDRIAPDRWGRKHSPARQLLPTDPADPFEAESHPYALAWAVAEGEETRAILEGDAL
jgi:hypothetical protein